MEREAKKPSEMVDRRENEASSDQMKADGREIDRASSPFRAGFQKNLANQTSSQKTSLSRSALNLRKNASCINNLYAEFQFTPANIGFVTRTPASWPRNLIKVLFGGA